LAHRIYNPTKGTSDDQQEPLIPPLPRPRDQLHRPVRGPHRQRPAIGVGKNTVRSPQIVDGTVRTVDLRDEAVAAGKIAENAVASPQVAPDSLSASDLGPSSVTSSEVADQSLTAEDLGPNSVGSSEIQAGAIRSSELGPIIQASNSTAIAAGANGGVSVNCPEGTTVISGGAQPANFGVEMTSTLRSGNGWQYQAKNNNGSASTP
jgi:hypothetical protein